MRRIVQTMVGGAAALVMLAACGAARDIKDAADGIKNFEKDTKDLEAKLARAKDLTYTATYEVKTKDGKVETLVVAQKPPKSSYHQGDVLIVDDGNRVASCSKSNGKDECVDIGAHTDAGIYGLGAGAGYAFAFNPAAFPGLYAAAAIVPGVDAGKSTRDIAGQSSDCLSIKVTSGTDKGQGLQGCTTQDGIFSEYNDGDGNLTTLVKFERSADDSNFKTPVKVRTTQDMINDSTSTTAPSSRGSSTSSTSTTFQYTVPTYPYTIPTYTTPST